MAEVNVEINGRKYRMACEDGQEEHLMGLARRFNEQIDVFKGDFGEIGDNRLTVMAGIALLDTLVEMEKRLDVMRIERDALTKSGEALAGENEALQKRLAGRLSEIARSIEQAAGTVEEFNRASSATPGGA